MYGKSGPSKMTPEVLIDHCKKNKLYVTPELNDVMYLHFQGFSKIENLEKYSGLKCLWLESNVISKIEGLKNQSKLKSLYMQHNMIKKIEGLESCRELDTLVLSHNSITKIENCHSVVLPLLNTLNISHNYLKTYEDIELLKQCLNLSVLDVSHNQLDDILVLKVLSEMPSLHVLTMTGNPVISMIPNYRKTLILECKSLTYLDTRPIFPRDRFCAEAWKRGGHVEERKAHEKWNRDERRKIRRSLNATLSLRKDAEGNPVALIPSSDEEDETVDENSNVKGDRCKKEDAMDIYEDQQKKLETLHQQQKDEIELQIRKKPIRNIADIFTAGEPYFDRESAISDKPTEEQGECVIGELEKLKNVIVPDFNGTDKDEDDSNASVALQNSENEAETVNEEPNSAQSSLETPPKLSISNDDPIQDDVAEIKKPLIQIIESSDDKECKEEKFQISEAANKFPISETPDKFPITEATDKFPIFKKLHSPSDAKKSCIEIIENEVTPSPTRLRHTVLKSPHANVPEANNAKSEVLDVSQNFNSNTKTNSLIKFFDVTFDSGAHVNNFECTEDGPSSIVVSKTPLIEVIEDNYVVHKKPEDLIQNIIESISQDEFFEAQKLPTKPVASKKLAAKIVEKEDDEDDLKVGICSNVMYEEVVREDSIVCSVQGDYMTDGNLIGEIVPGSVTFQIGQVDGYLDGSQMSEKPVVEFKLGKLESPNNDQLKDVKIENETFESLAWFEEGEPASLMFPSINYPSILNEDPEIVEIQKRDKDLEKVLGLCQEQKKEAMQLFFMNENEQLLQLYDEAADKNLIDRIGTADIAKVQKMCEEEELEKPPANPYDFPKIDGDQN